MSGTIELLRHGDTGQQGFRGQLDDALSALGWRQMRAAVAERRWHAIVSSPLERCAAFARELAQQHGVPMRLDARLAEYHFGQWQGLSMETLAERWPDQLQRFWADPLAHPPPQGESLQAFRLRLTEAIAQIAGQARWQHVLVITHGGVIRLLRCLGEGLPLGRMASLDVPHATLHRLPLEWLAG